MIWKQEEYEERQYPTPGRYLRGHKAAFERAGYPVNVQSAGPGVYILVVTLPASMPQEIDPYQLPARRRRSWRLDGRQVLSWLCVLVIVGGLGYLGYTLFAPAPQPAQAAQTKQADFWDWVDGLELPSVPALPKGEPQVEATGWQWPWESAAKAAADTAGAITQAVMVLVLLFVLGALAFAAIKIRRAR
jgi:hypothetical protein